MSLSNWLRRVFFSVGAALLIIFGLIVLPLPIPFGAIMIVVGLVILIATNRATARWLRSLRRLHPAINAWIGKAEVHLPRTFRRIMELTNPFSRKKSKRRRDDA
ncbi:MAG: hypothetical protein AAFV69_06940 [Pseudomonadota bacterium]